MSANLLINICYLSDSRGCLIDEEGFDYAKFSVIRDIRVQHRSLRSAPLSCFFFLLPIDP